MEPLHVNTGRFKLQAEGEPRVAFVAQSFRDDIVRKQLTVSALDAPLKQ
jgi:hypothetical protein